MLTMVQDSDCHWFIIPLSQSAVWYSWLEKSDEAGATGDTPDWAEHIQSPEDVSFSDYEAL